MNTFTAAVIEDDIERAIALATDEPIGVDPFKQTDEGERARQLARYFANRRKHYYGSDESADERN